MVTDECRGAVAQSENLPAPVVTSPSTLSERMTLKAAADAETSVFDSANPPCPRAS